MVNQFVSSFAAAAGIAADARNMRLRSDVFGRKQIYTAKYILEAWKNEGINVFTGAESKINRIERLRLMSILAVKQDNLYGSLLAADYSGVKVIALNPSRGQYLATIDVAGFSYRLAGKSTRDAYAKACAFLRWLMAGNCASRERKAGGTWVIKPAGLGCLDAKWVSTKGKTAMQYVNSGYEEDGE